MSIEINITDSIIEVTPTEQVVDINITENPIEVNVTDQIVLLAQTGLQGPKGDTGAGVPIGGITGQILAKNSGTNYDTLWINNAVGTVTSVNASGVSGISVSGGPVTSSGTLLITNTAPDQIVSLTGAGTTLISGTYPNFTITSNDEYDGTVTSVNASGGVGISVSGVPITSSGTLTITNTAPDQVVSLSGTGTTSISGTYPSFTINSADQYSGTVTSVGLISGTGIAVSGGPVTSSGNITVTNTAPDQIVSLSGSGTTTIGGTYPSFTISSADQYTGTVTSIATTAPITGGTITATGTIGITQSGIATDGYLSSTDWNTFNNKQGAITLTTTGTSGVSTLIGTTLNIPNYGSALTGYVPYTGATQNVDLGEYELKAGQLSLDLSPTGTAAVGTTRWNDTIGSSETTLKGGTVIIKNGVDLVARVVNKVTPNQTLTKSNYQAVRVSGAQGQRLAVAFAQGNNDSNSADTIGLVTETIATNQEGFIITVGQIEEINTTGSLQGETWVDGDVLYLSPTTAGALTNIKPNGSTGHIIVIGYVEYAHAVHGKIYVKVMNGWELDELHNVYINTPVNNQGLFYTSASQLWENKTIATALGYTPVNKAGDTMTGYLVLNADPVSGLGAATKDYVDNLANGIDWKQSANAGTVASLPSYAVTGSGQILTGSVNGAIPSATTDGVTLVAGNRLLVKSETSTLTPNNGIYVVTQAGDGSSPFILTRSADANASSELSEATLSISGGSTLSNTQWHCNPASTPITIGTTYISFSQIGSGVYFGTAPISVSGNTISISQSSGSTNGYLSSTDWTTFNNKQNTLSLTTTGASGSSTLVGSTLNVPTYTLNGLGGASATTTITINGTSQDLSANRTYNVGTVTSVAALTLGTTGTDLSSTVATGTTTPVITLNVPTASATNRGALSSADWTTFNNKQNALTLTTTGTSGAATLVGATLNIPQYQAAGTYVTSVTGTSPIVSSGGTTPAISIPAATASVNGYLTSADWTTFNGKFNLPSLTAGSVLFSNGTTIAQDNANFFWDDTNNRLGIGTTSPWQNLHVIGTTAIGSAKTSGAGSATISLIGGVSDTREIGYVFSGAANREVGAKISFVGSGNLSSYQGGYITFSTSEAGGTTFPEAMRITGDGNVGIGTTSPTDKLQVSGTGDIKTKITTTSTGSGANVSLYLDATTEGQWTIQTGNAVTKGLRFYDVVAGAERARIDASGNLGLGVTPTAFSNSILNLQVGSKLSLNFGGTTGALSYNSYFNAGFKYLTTDFALDYRMNSGDGSHQWYTAPSGTAGAAISFTQAMTLNASGRLLLGTATDDGSNKLQVAGSAKVSTNQNAATKLELSNTTSGTLSQSQILLTSDASSGISQITKYSGTTTDYKNATNKSLILYNGTTGGDIALLNDFATGKITFSAGSSSTTQMTLTAAGRLLLGTTSESTNLLEVSKNQNAATTINISNSTSGTTASSAILFNASAGIYKYSASTTAYKIFASGDFGHYNGPTGDFAILNDTPTGKIKFAAGGASAAQATITADGRLLLGTTTDNGTDRLQVNGSGLFGNAKIGTWSINSDYARFGHQSYDGASSFGFLQKSDGNIYVVGTETYINGVNNLFLQSAGTTRLTIASTGAATFSSSVTAISLLLNGGSLIGNFTINGGTGDTITQNAIQTFTRTSSTGNVLAGKIVLVTSADATNYGNLVLRVKSTPSSGESDAYYTNALTLVGSTGAATFSSSVTAGEISTTGASAGFRVFRRDTNVYAGGWYSPSGSILLDMVGYGTAVTFAVSTGAATFSSSVTASSLIKSGGTSAQILAADGSVITAGTNITISGGTISASGGGGITGSGTTNYIPKWTSTSAVGDSAIAQSASGNRVLMGITLPTDDTINALQVNGGAKFTNAHLGAGTTSIAPLKFTTGVLKTTPAAGDMEVDSSGYLFYTESARRGVISPVQWIANTATRTFVANTNSQNMFDTGSAGANTFTAVANTTYIFEVQINLTGLSSTANSVGFGFALTGAVVSNISYMSIAEKTNTIGTPTAPTMCRIATSATTAVTPSTNQTAAAITIKGIVRFTTGGSVTPVISQIGATAASVLGIGSYVKFQALGSDTDTKNPTNGWA